MSEERKFVSAPMQSNHLQLQAAPWVVGEWQRATMQWRIVNNNVRGEVYLNDPNEANKAIGDRAVRTIPIAVRTNYVAFTAMLDAFEAMTHRNDPCTERMATKGRSFNYETLQVSPDITVTSVLSYGRNAEGLMFLAAEDKTMDRRQFMYTFGDDFWHPVRTDEGDIDKVEQSNRYCRAWIRVIRDLMALSAYHQYIPEENLRAARKEAQQNRQKSSAPAF